MKFFAKLIHWFSCWEVEKGRNETHRFMECIVCGWRRCIVLPGKARGMSAGMPGYGPPLILTAPVESKWAKWIKEGQKYD